ncbi:hypothetical protein HAHE_11600 [Haloferula helveola]|uniref:Cytochrome c domain-containing protein n=1 Tax=Haloferula helveola TaxID=490095 RepID=A0ABN6H2Q2_9BACT|nr:hypothetical protein HAHE_11600 [Haloferula helveola]
MLRLPLSIAPLTLAVALGGEPLTYDVLPLGEIEKPLLLRTYVPDPGLDDEVFVHHGTGAESPRYSVNDGKDTGGKPFKPIEGIPAAIAINHGPALSYVFDTTECRMLYAWQGGFLDMFPYWGDEKGGNRRSFDYVPRLVGTVFTMASGSHPLSVGGKPVGKDLKFVGYDLDGNGVPTFRFKANGHEVTQRIEPVTDTPLSCSIRIASEAPLEYRAAEGEKVAGDGKSLVVTVTGSALSKHNGFERNLKIKTASAAAGEDVFVNYGCIACHSTDGSLGHGPSLKGLFGSKHEIEGMKEPIVADEAYIRESILKPNAKTAKGFPPNYMPPYPLKDIEVDSLVLFIRSLVNE